MKKIFSLYITLLLALTLTQSCSKTEETFKIGISQCSNDVWRQQMNKEISREASFHHKKLHLDFRSANEDNALQIRQIDSLVNEGIDLLVVSPNEAKALTPIVEKVYAKGIPVVVVDRKINSDKYTAFVGADNERVGHDAGEYIISKLGGKGCVVEFAGQMAATAAMERHQGFMKAMKSAPGITVAANIEAGWEGTKVRHQVDSLFAAGTIPDVVFAHNDRTGVKVYNAARRAGKELMVVGIDGLFGEDGGLSNVEKGELEASFIYPTGGDRVVQTVIKILKGEPYEKENVLNSAIITPSTARIFRLQSDQVIESEKRIDILGSQIDRSLSRSSMQSMLLVSCVTIIILIAIVLVIALRSYFITSRHNQELAQQKKKLELQRDQLVQLSKELEASTQSKLKFFTEVSHELRTPLTLILAPIEQLLESQNLLPEQKKMLDIIHNNSNILQRLVDQTLDFRKMETGQLKLNPQHVNLCESVQKWCEPFRALAHKKMIRYSLSCQQSEQDNLPKMGWIDSAKMESVMYNLLSNAFKFTPEGGKISVTVSYKDDAEQGKRMTIVTEDSGKGIAKEKIDHVFDLFYQTDVANEGSGIGLATAKSYVELHGGTMRVESALGRGSRFIVEIPYDSQESIELAQHRSAAMMAEKKSVAEPTYATNAPESDYTDIVAAQNAAPKTAEEEVTKKPGKESDEDNKEDKKTILVIDDNEDIRSYIRILLNNKYIVEEAADGKEGFAKACKIVPDAIVCDVMMPVMNGWECCRRVKDERQTSHIPIMMLTACTLEEQRIMGFDCGADAYLDKPFSPEIFRARLNNLIENRQRLRAFFSSDKADLEKEDVSDLDKGFADRFRQLVEKNLSNPDFSVEVMANEMGFGRSQLYRKVKSLTGNSPVELLRVARLKKGADLLTRSEKTVSEVAYEVGFSSPGYFTKCFRDYFGVNPSDYTKA